MKKSRTAGPSLVVESPAVRSLPLVELLVDTKAELFELMVRSGLRVLDAMLEEDRTTLCGPRYAHPPERTASRAGKVPSEVVLGGRKLAVQRPRVRADGREVPLPTFQTLAHTDPLNRRVVDQMLVGVATRQYARSLEPVPADVVSRGTSKSSVSRRFVAKTTAQLRAIRALARRTAPIRMSELAEALGIVRRSATSVVDDLEHLGFARRVDDPTDRRAVGVELTPAGRKLMADARRRRRTAAGQVLGSLADQELREGVKVYSDWPTYPQLYVRGELVGGCDIIKEMHQSGIICRGIPQVGVEGEDATDIYRGKHRHVVFTTRDAFDLP